MSEPSINTFAQLGSAKALVQNRTQRLFQSALGEVFADLSNKSPELQDEFLYNADTQRALVKGGEQLIGALNFFVSSVNTLCNKTMEDSIDTVRRYESARLDIEKLLRVLLSRTLDFGNGTVVG